jgi:hypothetical protein
MAEKLTVENDIDLIRTSPDLDTERFLSARDESERRSRPDRRRFSYTAHVPERRSGFDRRQNGRRN